MRSARSPGALVVLGLLGVCGVLWWLRAALEPEPAARPSPAASSGAAPRGATSGPARSVVPELPSPAAPREAPDLRGHDTVDPCTASYEPMIPSGFATAVADGITVAWQPGPSRGPYDAPVQPSAIAHLVNGLLAEAAALTGTVRRERLAVVIYPLRDSFLVATGAPAWSDGVYDGGAVRLALQPSADLGVSIPALRHELMHAQLHAGAGCMPGWLNEGLAMYFAGVPPIAAWLGMLRAKDDYDLRALAVPSFIALSKDQAERAYAESLAMIVALVARSGEAGLEAAIQTLREGRREAPRAGFDLWDRLVPGAGQRELVDTIARKMFGIAPGPELEAMLGRVVCCTGLRTIGDLACRSVPPRADRKRWHDLSEWRIAICNVAWDDASPPVPQR